MCKGAGRGPNAGSRILSSGPESLPWLILNQVKSSGTVSSLWGLMLWPFEILLSHSGRIQWLLPSFPSWNLANDYSKWTQSPAKYIGNCDDSACSRQEGEQKPSSLRCSCTSIFVLRSSVLSFSFVNRGSHVDHSPTPRNRKHATCQWYTETATDSWVGQKESQTVGFEDLWGVVVVSFLMGAS